MLSDFDRLVFMNYSQRELDQATRNAYDAYVNQGVRAYILFTYGKGEAYTQAGPDGSI